MAKKRGRGVLKGAIGYPGPKEVTTQNLPEGVADDLRANETRLGVSKTALTAFAIRKVKLYQYSLADIKQDIEHATMALKAKAIETRTKRWKPVLAK